MEKSPQCGQAPRKGKPGFVFIVALLSMLAMVVVGTSFIGSANQQMQDARRDLDMLHAIAMADTGLNYLIWRQRYSTNKIMTIYDELTDLHALTPNSTPPPQVAPATLMPSSCC